MNRTASAFLLLLEFLIPSHYVYAEDCLDLAFRADRSRHNAPAPLQLPATTVRAPEVSPLAMRVVQDDLNLTRPHLNLTHFEARAVGSRNAVEIPFRRTAGPGMETRINSTPGMRSRNGRSTLSAEQTVMLEPIPNGSSPGQSTISRVEILDSQGGVLGELVPEAPGGRVRVPVTTTSGEPYRLRFHSDRGTAIDWNTNTTHSPEGLRYTLNDSQVAERGLSGGHLRENWEETLRTYPEIQVRSQTSRTFTLPGSSRPIQLTNVNYNYNGRQIRDPKTLFEGGNAALQAFEEHAAPYLTRMLQGMPTEIQTAAGAFRHLNQFTVRIPVFENGSLSYLEIAGFRAPPSPGNPFGHITTWWPVF